MLTGSMGKKAGSLGVLRAETVPAENSVDKCSTRRWIIYVLTNLVRFDKGRPVRIYPRISYPDW